MSGHLARILETVLSKVNILELEKCSREAVQLKKSLRFFGT
jgi:hypothetical protein